MRLRLHHTGQLVLCAFAVRFMRSVRLAPTIELRGGSTYSSDTLSKLLDQNRVYAVPVSGCQTRSS